MLRKRTERFVCKSGRQLEDKAQKKECVFLHNTILSQQKYTLHESSA